MAACAVRSSNSASPVLPRAEYARDSRSLVWASSIGRSISAQIRQARRRCSMACSACPRASSTLPRARAPEATSAGDVIGRGDRLQLRYSLRGRVDLAAGDVDLHQGRQQFGTGERGEALVSNRTRSIIERAASDFPSANRNRARPGCGSRPRACASLNISLGTGQIAHAQADLAQLVERLTRDVGQEVHHLFGRAPRLVFRLLQRTSQPKNPGPVNAADARVSGAGVVQHQLRAASFHSAARPTSPSCSQVLIMLQ